MVSWAFTSRRFSKRLTRQSLFQQAIEHIETAQAEEYNTYPSHNDMESFGGVNSHKF